MLEYSVRQNLRIVVIEKKLGSEFEVHIQQLWSHIVTKGFRNTYMGKENGEKKNSVKIVVKVFVNDVMPSFEERSF